MQAGELIVTGSDHVDIELSEKPEKIIVHFIDGDTLVVPCNPHHHDELSWHSFRKHHDHRPYHHHYSSTWILSIKWKVSGVRKIAWKVKY